MRVERLIMRIKRKAEEDAGLEKAIKRADHSHCRKLNSSYDSRIVRVSRSSGGKDRHSKVLTAKGLRDRRVRLSVSTAIQFYDLQERLGVDQPSKALEWLIKAAADAIDQLPALNMPAAFQATQQTSIPLQSIRNSTPDCPLETLKVNEKSVSEALGGSFFDASQELRKLPEANTKAVLKRRSTSIADGGKRVNDSCPPVLSHCRLRSRAMAGHIQTKRKALKECRKERGNLSFTDLSQNVVSMGAQDYTVKLISGTSDHSLASDHPEKTLSTTSSHVGLTNAGNQIRYQCLEQHKDKKKPVHLPDSISSQNYSNPPVAGSAAIPVPIIGNPLPITGNTDMHRNSSELQAQLLPYDRMPSFSAARSLICGRETLQSNSSHNFMNYYMQSHRQALSQRLNEVLSCAPFQGYDAQRSIHEFGVHESSNITTLPLPKQFRYPHQHPYS